ncbi:MAG: hypothetical protein Kow0059_13740 [Candidatus Sumerlaeia bacterium]
MRHVFIRAYWVERLAVIALLAAYLVQVVLGARHKTQTADEGVHYAYGRNVLAGQMGQIVGGGGLMPVSALNVLAVRARQALSPRPLTGGTPDIPSLFWARLPTAAMGALVLLLTWLLGRFVGGPPVGVAAMALGAFDPNLIAHGKWVTIDMASTAGMTLGMLGIIVFVSRPTPARLLLLGLGVALAQLTKFTNLFLFGVYPLLAAVALAADMIAWRRLQVSAERPAPRAPAPARGMTLIEPLDPPAARAGSTASVRPPAPPLTPEEQARRRALRRRLTMRLGWYLLGGAAVMACYIPVVNVVYGHWGPAEPLGRRSFSGAAANLASLPLIRSLPVPLAPEYLRGLEAAMLHNVTGHYAYFHGRNNLFGFRGRYFPALFAFKTPLPVLILLGLSLILGAVGLRQVDRLDAFLLIPALLYFSYFTFAITVNIGHRHLLPIYPLLFVLAARVLQKKTAEGVPAPSRSTGRAARTAPPPPDWFPVERRNIFTFRTVFVVSLIGWLATDTLRVFPHHLSYFNQLIGGPNNGWRWFNDSNVDWGQDNWFVEQWQRRHPEQRLIINPPGPTPGLIAVNVNSLTGIMGNTGYQYKWLRDNYEPAFYITPVWPVWRVPDSVRQVALALDQGRTRGRPGLQGRFTARNAARAPVEEGDLAVRSWTKEAWAEGFAPLYADRFDGLTIEWHLDGYWHIPTQMNSTISLAGGPCTLSVDGAPVIDLTTTATSALPTSRTAHLALVPGFHSLRLSAPTLPAMMPILYVNNIDLTEQIWAPDTSPPPAEPAPGLQFTLFNDPNLDQVLEQGVHSQIRFDWGQTPPSPRMNSLMYSFRWQGWVNVPREGLIRFHLLSDDGGRVFVAGVPVLDDWLPHPPHTTSEAIWLPAGLVPLVVEYHNDIYGAVCVLMWSRTGPGGTPEPPAVIPPEALFHEAKR